MKMSNIKYLLYMVCGVICCGSLLTSCQADDLGPIPQEELYVRGFIKKYGLIDPNQDWNLAERNKVTVNVDYADEVNVFVKLCDRMYRVACFAEVEGSVDIPVDVPEGTKTLYVSIDGVMYETTLGGSVTPSASNSRGGSRTVPDVAVWKTDWSTGGVKTTEPTTVTIPKDGYLIFDEVWINAHLGDENNPTIFSNNGVAKPHIFKNLRTDDHLHFILSTNNSEVTSYMLTFRTQTNTEKNTTLSVIILDESGKIYLDAESKLIVTGDYSDNRVDDEESSTKHSFYIPNLPANGTYQMIVTAVSKNHGATAGVWGAFEIKEATASDITDMTWIIAAEDLGATDDFDFNDVVFRISSVTMNTAALYMEEKQWQVVTDQNANVSLTSQKPKARAANDIHYTRLQITSMCAGGILDSYLHFHDGTNDFVLKPGDNAVDLTSSSLSTSTYKNVKLTDASVTTATDYEWHNWFAGENGDEENNRLMLNTGLNTRSVRTATIVVPASFSMSNYSVCYRNYGMEASGSNYSDFFDSDGHFKYDQSEMWKDPWNYDANTDKILGFYMTVGDADPREAITSLGASRPGSAPQMFLIPDVGYYGSWYWPWERVDITHVYPSFTKWVNNVGNYSWYYEQPSQQAQSTKEGESITTPYILRSAIPNLE